MSQFESIIPASATPPAPTNFKSRKFKIDSLQQNMSLNTILLIGAALQSTLLLLPMPKLYAVAPAILLLLFRILNTALITVNLIPNPYLKDAILKKSTAQMMDKQGNFQGPGQEKVAILLLGAKSNHPLGVFAPDFGLVGNYLERMTKELENDPTQDSGFLGQTAWVRKDDNGANEQMFISYWRSLEDVHRYAHGPTHRQAWKWWESTLKQHNYIGFMHEVFEADRGQWESVYINFQPTLMGKTTYLKQDGKLVGGEVKEEWISPLMDANRGPLRTSNGRRKVADKKDVIEEMFSRNAYEVS